MYTFRLCLTKTQAVLMDETMETCRRLYDDLLDERIQTNVKEYASSGWVSADVVQLYMERGRDLG